MFLTMRDTHKFWEWVDSRMGELGIRSISELERRSNTSNGTIRIRISESKLPTIETSHGLARALQVSWTELWMKAGLITLADIALLQNRLSEQKTEYSTTLDKQIELALKDRDESFKRVVLEIIQAMGRRDDQNAR